MASNLVRKQITDKNGVSSTRWVKPESSGSSTTRVPLPFSSPSPAAEAKRIGKEIRKYLSETDLSGRSNTWSHNDFSHFRALIEEGDHSSLRVIQEMLPLDSPYGPGDVGLAVRQLGRKGHENPAALVNEATLDARDNLIKAIDLHGAKKGIPYLSEREGSENVYLMAFTDTEDVPRIATIISERGMMSPEEIRGVLAQMDANPVPLQKGVL
jgi:hypothetical protein